MTHNNGDGKTGLRGVSIADVARECGFSTATVSRVLSGRATAKLVTESTRRKVLSAAQRVNYRPSRLPQILRSGRSGTICFSIPSMEYWNEKWLHQIFDHPPILSFITGYSMILLTALEKQHRDVNVLFDFRRPRDTFEPVDFKMDFADGIIYAAPYDKETDAFRHIVRLNFPIVFDTIMPEEPEFYCVGGDNAGTAHMAVRYMAALGRKRIRLVAPEMHDLPTTRQRLEGYAAALTELGLEPLDCPLFSYLELHQGRSDVMDRILGSGPSRADALIFCDTICANYFETDAALRGLRIPDDVSVLCLGDRMECQVSIPPISVLWHPTPLVYSKALNMLIELINGREPAARHGVVAPEFIIRGSCGGSAEAAMRLQTEGRAELGNA